jgi:hypothetical protein
MDAKEYVKWFSSFEGEFGGKIMTFPRLFQKRTKDSCSGVLIKVF